MMEAHAPARYAGPPSPASLAARLGISLVDLCKLDANESPFGPPPAALAALATLAAPVWAGRYPDSTASSLRATLESATGVPAEQIVVGNGSDELIKLLVEVLVSPGDEVVVCEPTFGLYALAAGRAGATVVDAGFADGFQYDAARIITVMQPRTRIVFLCGPNNPTGGRLTRDVLEAVLQRASELGRPGDAPLVVLDEAYYEVGAFGGDPLAWTAVPLVRDGAHLVVLRTFSKLYGLAGLRVGHACCPPALAARLMDRKMPYNVNSAGLVAAEAAIRDEEWLRERARILIDERDRVRQALSVLPGLIVHPSAANFLLVETGAGMALPLWERLLDQGIMVRRYGAGPLSHALRVSIGTPAQNDRLLVAMRTLCNEKPRRSR